MNDLECFHASLVSLQCRTGQALRHVGEMQTTEVKKAILRAEIEMHYLDEEELLRSYYGIWAD